MRSWIMAAGVFVALLSLFSARTLMQDRDEKALEVVRLRDRVSAITQKIVLLKAMRSSTPVAIGQAYVDLNNDLSVLARTHSITYALEIEGSDGTDIAKADFPSTLDGLKELRVGVIFAGLKQRGALISLLDGIGAVAQTLPVMIKRVRYEKNSLAVDFLVVGPKGDAL